MYDELPELLPELILINVNSGDSLSCCFVVTLGKGFHPREPQFPIVKWEVTGSVELFLFTCR